MSTLFRTIISAPGFKLSDTLRRRVILAALLLVLALVAFTAYRLGHHMGLVVGADQPGWENAILATTIGFRAGVALGLAGTVVVLAVGAFQILDRSALGQRLFHWDTTKDSGYTEASKTLSAGLVFAGMLLGFFVLAAAVLK
jgi:hypothetical protein